MSEPEIARRCSSCGASIRERAFFCPQCGLSLGDDQPALIEIGNGRKGRKNKPSPSPVEEEPAPRVQKERRLSSVVLNEVAYDPSFRFVLIAALLFLIFLVIVIMSKVIT